MAQISVQLTDVLHERLKWAAKTRNQSVVSFVRDAAYTMARRMHDSEALEMEPAPYHPTAVPSSVESGLMMVREGGVSKYVRVDPKTGFVIEDAL